LRTNPNSMHTDSDFVEDFYEVAIGEDPRTPERGPQGQPIPGVPKGPVPPPDPVYPMPPYDPDQPIRPGVPNPLPDGPQALIDSDGVEIAALGAPSGGTDWTDPSATENLDPPDVQAEYSGGGFTGTDWNDPSATENLDPPDVQAGYGD
jgi:hypothetical protein